MITLKLMKGKASGPGDGVEELGLIDNEEFNCDFSVKQSQRFILIHIVIHIVLQLQNSTKCNLFMSPTI